MKCLLGNGEKRSCTLDTKVKGVGEVVRGENNSIKLSSRGGVHEIKTQRLGSTFKNWGGSFSEVVWDNPPPAVSLTRIIGKTNAIIIG